MITFETGLNTILLHNNLKKPCSIEEFYILRFTHTLSKAGKNQIDKYVVLSVLALPSVYNDYFLFSFINTLTPSTDNEINLNEKGHYECRFYLFNTNPYPTGGNLIDWDNDGTLLYNESGFISI